MYIKFAIKRILAALPTALLVITFIFIALYILPGDPVEALVDVDKGMVTEEYLDQIREELGLNDPPAIRYINYLKKVVTLDFGNSWKTRRPVIMEIRVRLIPTISLAISGVLISLFAGIPLGVISALKRNKLPDYLLTILSVGGMAAPNFWLALLLLYLFAFKIPLFPVLGQGDSQDPLSFLWHLALPAIALGGHSAGLITRMTRSSMLEVLNSEYVRTARAKGVHNRQVILRHALSNALIPIVSMAGLTFVFLLGGSVAIETVFAREGLGALILRSITDRDAPLLQGTMVIFILMIVIGNAALDIIYALIDPRITHE
jgi:ABC-type dipeptide/oligopeptide/nickel transport system permease component